MPKPCGFKQKRKKMVAPTMSPYRNGRYRDPLRKTARVSCRETKESIADSGALSFDFKAKDWKLGRVLGQGYFGRVVLAKHVQTREVVAWKRFSTPHLKAAARRGSRLLELLEREIQIHRSLDHPNITPFLGYQLDREHVTLVLGFADKGDLFDYSTKHCHTYMDRARLFHQVYPSVLAAVAYLETLQISHRDIKPENILLKSSHRINDRSVRTGFNVQPQLCDFGWSVWYLKAGARRSTLCGTPEYVPPELLVEDTPTRRRRYSAEFVDPWSLGVLALEVLRGMTPFGAPPNCPETQVRAAIYAKIRSFDHLAGSVRTELNDLAIVVASSHFDILPRVALETWKNGNRRNGPYVSLIEDFLQTKPCLRLSATECLEQYANLFRGASLPTPSLPSVRQRRQIFQSNPSSAASPSLIL